MEFKYKKKFGQNFLQDDTILNKIVDLANLTDKDLVIEVGPGQGALTKKLKAYNPFVICYEIDEETKPYLDKLENEKVIVKFGDFLDVDIAKDIAKYDYENLYVIANLPYYITTPIIQKIIDSKINPKRMLLMVQKEVAERFNAKPRSKAYNSLTVYLNYQFDIKTEFIVGRNSFYPVPNVDSAIISMNTKIDKLYLESGENFDKLLRNAFKHKRKTLKNNLGEIFDLIFPLLESKGYLSTVRAEEMTLGDYVEISNYLSSQEK